MATKDPKERKRPRQGYLPDMEPPSIKAVDRAALAYVEARDERMAKLKAETDAKDNLLALLKEHNLTSYEFDGYTVTITSTADVKVRRKKEQEGGDE